jgi:hypothetical protein
MRQRLLNGVLPGSLAGLFCLLAATAYTEVRQGDGVAVCNFEKRAQNQSLGQPAARCEIRMAATCDTAAGTARNGRNGTMAACIAGGKIIVPARTNVEQLPQAGNQLKE